MRGRGMNLIYRTIEELRRQAAVLDRTIDYLEQFDGPRRGRPKKAHDANAPRGQRSFRGQQLGDLKK